jgi:hypothetical protein
VDQDFTPQVCGFNNCQYITSKATDWKRPCQLIDNPCFITGGMTADDIHQGNIGNCYFISALGALCQRPDLITQCFVSQDMRPLKVFFKTNDHKVTITVDDLPVNSWGRLVCGCSNTKNEFGFLYLRKRMPNCYTVMTIWVTEVYLKMSCKLSLV